MASYNVPSNICEASARGPAVATGTPPSSMRRLKMLCATSRCCSPLTRGATLDLNLTHFLWDTLGGVSLSMTKTTQDGVRGSGAGPGPAADVHGVQADHAARQVRERDVQVDLRQHRDIRGVLEEH